MSILNKDNLSAVLHAKDDLRMEQMPLPGKPEPDEVLLETLCVGICGSDVHYWRLGHIGDFILTTPMVLGHEAAGEVVEPGAGVKDIKTGDHVVFSFVPICGHCMPCMTARPAL